MTIALYQLDGLQPSSVIFTFVSEFARHIEIKSLACISTRTILDVRIGLPVINSERLMHAAITKRTPVEVLSTCSKYVFPLYNDFYHLFDY